MNTINHQNGNPSPIRHERAPALLRASIGLAVVSLVVFGFAYSMAGVGLGQLFFADKANGSLVEVNGRVVGSTLVAQPFVQPGYFVPRPSAAAYDPMAAAGSNQSQSNPDAAKRIQEQVQAIAKREGIDPAQVPADLATQSGSGTDPDISPQGADIQVDRVARARGVSAQAVRVLVQRYTQHPTLGFLGESRVNVLALNVALDAEFGAQGKTTAPGASGASSAAQ